MITIGGNLPTVHVTHQSRSSVGAAPQAVLGTPGPAAAVGAGWDDAIRRQSCAGVGDWRAVVFVAAIFWLFLDRRPGRV
jgi:hypothetical protein